MMTGEYLVSYGPARQAYSPPHRIRDTVQITGTHDYQESNIAGEVETAPLETAGADLPNPNFVFTAETEVIVVG